MMNAAIVPDFNLQDLTRPNPKRFKRQMSALVNFHRFREDRVREFDSLTAEAEELDQRRATLVAEVRDMSEAIEDHK